eukprot:218209-Rhodomonas_salina.1
MSLWVWTSKACLLPVRRRAAGSLFAAGPGGASDLFSSSLGPGVSLALGVYPLQFSHGGSAKSEPATPGPSSSESDDNTIIRLRKHTNG